MDNSFINICLKKYFHLNIFFIVENSHYSMRRTRNNEDAEMKDNDKKRKTLYQRYFKNSFYSFLFDRILDSIKSVD